jgi:cytochrome b6-f complex iron-sulfur subunit
MVNRRNFVRQTAAWCIVPGVVASLLNSCKSAATYTSNAVLPGIIQVPVSAFVEGSDRINVRDKRLEFDVLLLKKPNNEYKAIYMKCTHYDNPLVASSTSIYCNSHGSQFDMDGKVMKDPASTPLRIFPTSFENQQIQINIQ